MVSTLVGSVRGLQSTGIVVGVGLQVVPLADACWFWHAHFVVLAGTAMPYASLHECAARAGRKPMQGAYFQKWAPIYVPRGVVSFAAA